VIDPSEFASNVWSQIEGPLTRAVTEAAAFDKQLMFHVGQSTNAAFPMRAYATLRKAPNLREFAITVDLDHRDGALRLSADACFDDGELIAEGPSLSMVDIDAAEVEHLLDSWLVELREFLASVGLRMAEVLPKL